MYDSDVPNHVNVIPKHFKLSHEDIVATLGGAYSRSDTSLSSILQEATNHAVLSGHMHCM